MSAVIRFFKVAYGSVSSRPSTVAQTDNLMLWEDGQTMLWEDGTEMSWEN
jgi:hypothetical protein